MVLPPLSLGKETLQGLVKWLGSHGNDFSPGQLVETVLRLAPDLHALMDSSLQGHWQRFFASFFRKVLNGKTSTMSDVNNIAAFVFELRDITSVMKSLMVCLLDASFSHAPDLDSFVSAQCPMYMQFLFGKCGLQLEEKPFDSDGTHVAFVLLCDVIYESINFSTIEALVRGDDGLEWSFEDFFKCLNTALELMDADGPLTIQLIAAFAFLRAIQDAVASELVHILRAEESTASLSSPVVSIFANIIKESSSPGSRFAALRLYLLKVLHMQRGLSLVEISALATRCGETLGLKDYTTLLEWETMHDVVANPLGFDPFWSSSTLFEKSGEAIHYVTSGQESRGRAFIESAATDHASQKQITAAVASRLYLPSAARALTFGERVASQWILSRPNCLQQWDPKWTEVVQCFAQGDRVTAIWNGMRLSPNMPTQDLWFKSLAAHILFVVTDLPRTSPLQGYMALDEEHLERAYVLGAPNTSLAAFRTIVAKGNMITDYKCSCGFQYFIGECGKPVVSTTCPDCKKPIGGANYVPAAGTVHLQSDRTETGYIIDNVSRSDTFYSVRNLDHKCYRALRLILHFCLGIGLQRASTTDQALRRLLGLAPQGPPHPQEELHNIIEEDFGKLDLLLACNRDTTVKYMHSVVSFLSGMQNHVALLSADARVQWEAEFQRIFSDNVSFGSGAQRAAADYLERQKGDDRYAELVGERGRRMFASPVEDLLRITASPSLANFRALYKQDPGMIAESPLIQVFFDHEKDLEDLRHLMNLVLFCNTAHEVFSSRISRPKAATMSMREALKESSGLGRQFGNFEKSWNAIREKVMGYECRTFSVPIMDKDAPLAMCLVEPRDLGLYIVAIFEYLRNIQNTFLDAHASPAVGTSAHGHSRRTVRVQTCKTEDIVHSDEQWLENVVKEVAIANPRSGCGLRLLYDSVIIQEHLLRALVTGKAHLEADWMEFPYKHEAFHRHATILADVATAIPQEVLRSETLQTVHREIELGGVGAGQFLEMLNLCLGFLRRTGGPSQQTLSSYCKLWLDNDSAELISTSTVFDKICLKHIVSLYEGLEDSASSNVEMLVRKKYKTPLTSGLVKEILDSVKTETAWKEEAFSSVEKIPVAAFLTVLRRFMYRYLSVDNHPEDVELHIYLTDSRLVKWPADVVSEDIVEDCFPPSLLLEHSFATYMLLSEISTGGDWEKAGQRNGWTTTR